MLTIPRTMLISYISFKTLPKDEFGSTRLEVYWCSFGGSKNELLGTLKLDKNNNEMQVVFLPDVWLIQSADSIDDVNRIGAEIIKALNQKMIKWLGEEISSLEV